MVINHGYHGIHPDDDPVLEDDSQGEPAEPTLDTEITDPPVKTSCLWLDLAN